MVYSRIDRNEFLFFRSREQNDGLGLNIRLFNQIESVIRSSYGPQITINESSVDRAIYFHGFLLEQTLKLFEVTTLETNPAKSNRLSAFELKQSLIRDILMLPQIIITKEDLYEPNGKNLFVSVLKTSKSKFIFIC